MPQDTRIPAGEPALREEEDVKRRDASREEAPQEQESRKESNPKEPLQGEPGYGEPPPEVRRDKLPDQGW